MLVSSLTYAHLQSPPQAFMESHPSRPSILQKNEAQVIRCNAAVCWGAGEAPVIEEIEVDPPGKHEVRLEVKCASLCHTDVMFIGGFPLALFPRVFGHEGVCMVESVGEGVEDVKEGDLVIPTYISQCNDCENCLSGITNQCLARPFHLTGLMHDGSSRMRVKGERLYHMFTCSTWSQYTVVNANFVVKIDPDVDHHLACLASCGFSTGYGAAWKEVHLRQGSSVAVFGLGAVGLGAVEGSKSLGASNIIGIDIQDTKQKIGEECGVTHFINPSKIGEKPIWEVVREMTGGLGVDCSFECTGASGITSQAMACTKLGTGTTVQIGSGHDVNINVNILFLSEGRTLKGTIFGGIRPRSDLPIILTKCLSGELKLGNYITHERPLEDIGQALQLMKEPECIKIILKLENN